MAARAVIIAKGKVQGVGFRRFVEDAAINLQLKGYTRNLASGDVETVAEGEKSLLQSLIEQIKKGSPLSKVTEVEVVWEEFQDEFDDFTVKS